MPSLFDRCLLRYGEHGENTVEHLHCVRTLADMVSQGTRAEQAAQALAFQQRTGMPVPGAERLSGRDTQVGFAELKTKVVALKKRH